MPGTRRRAPLFDEDGQRIRGKDHKEAAELAPAREKLSWEGEPNGTSGGGEWLVVRARSDYIQYCERGVKNGSVSEGHRDNAVRFLNEDRGIR